MKDEAMLALAKELAKNLKTEADLNNFSRALKKLTVETALNAELTDHLGYEKNSPRRQKCSQWLHNEASTILFGSVQKTVSFP